MRVGVGESLPQCLLVFLILLYCFSFFFWLESSVTIFVDLVTQSDVRGGSVGTAKSVFGGEV